MFGPSVFDKFTDNACMVACNFSGLFGLACRGDGDAVGDIFYFDVDVVVVTDEFFIGWIPSTYHHSLLQSVLHLLDVLLKQFGSIGIFGSRDGCVTIFGLFDFPMEFIMSIKKFMNGVPRV